MSEGQPFQPYEPPQPLDISTDPMVAPAVKTRPGGLTAIAVIALILGGLGIAAALFGIAGLFLGQQMQQMVPAAPAAPTILWPTCRSRCRTTSTR